MRGPHPFLKDNELSLHGGLLGGHFLGGTRAVLGYGYQLDGSLWLSLHAGVVDAGSGPAAQTPKCGCARVDTFADVMGGLEYRFATTIPLLPFVRGEAGLLYYFPEGVSRAAGVGIRGAGGAIYYLYDWLGFGAEVALLLGTSGLASHDAQGMATSFSTGVGLVEMTLGVHVQF